jgi:hypothetical protein
MHRKSHEKKIVSKGVEMNDLVKFWLHTRN